MTQGANNQYIQMKSEKDQNGPFHRAFENTAQKVAADHGVGEQTVKRSAKFAKGVDAAEAVEKIKLHVLHGAGKRCGYG